MSESINSEYEKGLQYHELKTALFKAGCEICSLNDVSGGVVCVTTSKGHKWTVIFQREFNEEEKEQFKYERELEAQVEK